MPELRSVVRTNVEHTFARAFPDVGFVYFTSDAREVIAEGFSDSGEISVIAKESFFLNREIQLRCFALRAVNDTQWIKGLAACFLRREKVIAPRL
jgi:hypothetical protein